MSSSGKEKSIFAFFLSILPIFGQQHIGAMSSYVVSPSMSDDERDIDIESDVSFTVNFFLYFKQNLNVFLALVYAGG